MLGISYFVHWGIPNLQIFMWHVPLRSDVSVTNKYHILDHIISNYELLIASEHKSHIGVNISYWL